MSPEEELQQAAKAAGLSKGARHIFLCADQTNAKCCDQATGLTAWNFLKSRLATLGRDAPAVLRTKANCLRVCLRGPVAVVYPDAIWYHSCTPEFLERVVSEHLIKGQPLKENRIHFPATDQDITDCPS